jgi:REP element-mobilizing transposase RayT
MIAGHHLIWTAYGCWLPNDPRGSSSDRIRVPRIAPLGELHPGRKRIQPRSAEIRRFYERAEELLAHVRLIFTDEEILLLGESFAGTIKTHNYTCYECAIMPDHVHMLIRRHRDKAEQMIQFFQEESKEKLIKAGHRSENHPVWGGPGWKVFLNTREDIERVIEYIRNNAIQIGRPIQTWQFVTRYDGWLPRLGR